MCLAVTEWMNLEELQQLLAMVDAFESLPPPEIRSLAIGGSLERVRIRQIMMVEPQEHARRLIVLLSGRAQIYEAAPRGRRFTVSVAEAGTVVGVAGLSARPRGLRVEALLPSLLCLVEWETFEGVVLRNPEVGLRLLRILGQRIGVLETRLADLAYKEVPARLASLLERLVEAEGVMGPEGSRIITQYTHQQLASMIGANREAVSRAFKTLRESGAVEVRDRRIHVADPRALHRAAHQA
jgi:CRP/FNR family cyclic AMP-dependent transcriptional regulator